MHESEQWDAIQRRRIDMLRNGEAGCVVEWESDGPEPLFVELADEHARTAGRILVIGCAVRVALPHSSNGSVVLLDLSRSALGEAQGQANHCSVLADARSLPFADGVFDRICSFPIPGAGTQPAFQECARVLSADGVLLGLVNGETHRIETQEIFGRGLGWPPAKPMRFAIPEAMRASGLEVSFLAEYFGASFCPDIQSFAADLEAQPVIPDFDAVKDAALLREVQRKLTCERGIRNTEHVALYAAYRRA